MLKCDICKLGNKGHYVSREVNGEFVTACDDCWYGKPAKKGKTKNQIFDELQTPFWKMIGAKPKPEEIKLERYLKGRGMSYGDWRRERDSKEARFQSAMPQFNEHMKRYGTGNAPIAPFEKRSTGSR